MEKIKQLKISDRLTGKMSGMLAITTSSQCNAHCKELAKIPGSICQHCYTNKYLSHRQNVAAAYKDNTALLSSGIIPKNQLPFVNATFCRLESFGDILNTTHLQNYINICNKNKHCIFALWSKQHKLINDYFAQHKQPSNLIIVASSILLNKIIDIEKLNNIKNLKIFTVYDDKYIKDNNININCGSNKCLNCLKCYTKTKNIEYISEKLK